MSMTRPATCMQRKPYPLAALPIPHSPVCAGVAGRPRDEAHMTPEQLKALKVTIETALEHLSHAENAAYLQGWLEPWDNRSWPPKSGAEPGTLSYHLAAVIDCVKRANEQMPS